METNGRFEVYTDQESEPSVNGLTLDTLRGLRKHLIDTGQITVSARTDEWNLNVGSFWTGKEYIEHVSLEQLQVILSRANEDAADRSPEQNRRNMLRTFDEVIANYSMSAFKDACPIESQEQLQEKPNSKKGFFFRSKPQPNGVRTVNREATKMVSIGNTVAEITVHYGNDEGTIVKSADVFYGDDKYISFTFGEDGTVNLIYTHGLLHSLREEYHLDTIISLRGVIKGNRDIPGTIEVISSPLVSDDLNAVAIEFGRDPKILFNNYDRTRRRYARYDDVNNQFVLELRGRSSKSHTFSVESTAKMIEELLSIVPLGQNTQQETEVYRPDDLR